MIENIRKFRFLIILGLAAVALGLVIGIKEDAFRGGSGGQPILRIDGRTYGEKEFNNLGSGALEIISGLAGSGDFGMYQYVIALSSGAMGSDAGREQFFANRILLRKAAREFGIHPGDEEVAEQIRSMRAFAGQDKKFDEQAYRRFVDRGIGRLGLTENDFRDLISDYLAYQKITAAIGAGLAENRDAIITSAALDSQQITGNIASLSIDAFEEDVQPSEEELKEYWETLRDSFTTEELRKFTYIIVTPEMPAEEEEAKETIADATATEEQKKAKEEAKARKAAERAVTKRNIQIETDKLVDDFSFQLEEQSGEGFEELAKKFGWETKTSEPFALATPPPDLDASLRSSSQGGKAVNELFRIEPTSDSLSKISQPIAINENQWLVAHLDEVIKPREKTYEEAKDEARFQYVKEKASAAMKKKAQEAIESIRKALTDGKSFADAAAEAGLKNIKSVEKIGSSYQPDPADEPGNLFQAGRYVTPGQMADVIIEDDRAFVFHVKSREVFKNPNPEEMINNQIIGSASTNEYTAFNDWLESRRDAAKVEQLYRN
jgi:hypothetical protein